MGVLHKLGDSVPRNPTASRGSIKSGTGVRSGAHVSFKGDWVHAGHTFSLDSRTICTFSAAQLVRAGGLAGADPKAKVLLPRGLAFVERLG